MDFTPGVHVVGEQCARREVHLAQDDGDMDVVQMRQSTKRRNRQTLAVEEVSLDLLCAEFRGFVHVALSERLYGFNLELLRVDKVGRDAQPQERLHPSVARVGKIMVVRFEERFGEHV